MRKEVHWLRVSHQWWDHPCGEFKGKNGSTLPENSFGNIWRFAVAAITKEESNLELHDLVVPVRKVKRKTNFDYAKKLQGEDAFSKACEPFKEVSALVSEGQADFFRFSSWVRFSFYNTDFGWGKPIYECIPNVPIKNGVIFMSNRSGDEIEA